MVAQADTDDEAAIGALDRALVAWAEAAYPTVAARWNALQRLAGRPADPRTSGVWADAVEDRIEALTDDLARIAEPLAALLGWHALRTGIAGRVEVDPAVHEALETICSLVERRPRPVVGRA